MSNKLGQICASLLETIIVSKGGTFFSMPEQYIDGRPFCQVSQISATMDYDKPGAISGKTITMSVAESINARAKELELTTKAGVTHDGDSGNSVLYISIEGNENWPSLAKILLEESQKAISPLIEYEQDKAAKQQKF